MSDNQNLNSLREQWKNVLRTKLELTTLIRQAKTNELAAMVEWLRCSTRIHKILCLNLSIIVHGMILNKSLQGKLSRMAYTCSDNASSVGTLDRRSADTTVRKKKKTVETGCMWTLIITAAGPNRR